MYFDGRQFSANRGYSGYSMSNRAEEAYEEGQMPLSKWTKKLIIDRCEEVVRDFIDDNNNIDLKGLNKLRKDELVRCVMENSSWHHTSQYFNKTDFYDVSSDKLEEMTSERIATIISNRQPKEKAEKKAPESRRARCLYLVWGGSKRHPKATKVIEEGTITGNWFVSDTNVRKSVVANGFEVLEDL